MFIQNLTREQQEVLLYLGKKIIAADGVLTDSEVEFIDALKSQMPKNTTENEVQYNDLPKIFNTNSSKASLLLELLGVAHADNEFQDSEKEMLIEIASHLHISKDKLFEMNDWVITQLELVKKASIFMLD
jgi:hypothetical protein